MKSPKKKTPLKRRCKAKSKQSGKQCAQAPIPGGEVCRFHGGAAPQVIAKARERLAALVDPAIDQLAKLLTTRKSDVALKAVKDVLDRNDLKAPNQVKVHGTVSHEHRVLDPEKLKDFTDDELNRALDAARLLTRARSGDDTPAAE